MCMHFGLSVENKLERPLFCEVLGWSVPLFGGLIKDHRKLEMSASGDGSVHWCHRCYHSIRLTERDPMIFPTCNGGFIEEIGKMGFVPRPDNEGFRGRSGLMEDRGRPFGAQVVKALSTLLGKREMDVHRRRDHGHDRISFNPWVILRGQVPSLDGENGNMHFTLDNIAGIRRMPTNVDDYFTSRRFDQLIEQLSQNGRCMPPPASKRTIDTMPTITITQRHLVTDSHCVVCKKKLK